MKKRFSTKLSGQSGQGINTLGEILAKCIKNFGYNVFAYREYPSLIKGGVASYQIDFSDTEILSSSKYTDILACIDLQTIHAYIYDIKRKGILVHSVSDLQFSQEEKKFIKEKEIEIVYIDTVSVIEQINAPKIMANIIVLGYICSLINIDKKILEKQIKKQFENKDIDMEAEIRCLSAGYEYKRPTRFHLNTALIKRKKWNRSLILTGNHAIALGAISAGCRAYYAYPMTPSTPILKTLGDMYKKTGMIVKQAESEITAVQMTMGSMYMGTRAFTATSGGGFDLMSETISASGITETPLVIVLGQRPGPSTGVPTWTSASDLDVALNTGHGEFPRCILSTSGVIDAYELIQKAFNIAEQFQIPVIVLTEKQNAESFFNISKLPKALKIIRGFKSGKNRYEILENGISPRWIPQKGNKTYLINSDEHTQEGLSTENPKDVIQMSEKRMRKLITLKNTLPEPKYFGSVNTNTVFVGMGTASNAVLDVINILDKDIGFLQYQYIYPCRYDKILQLEQQGKRLILIENNQTGQFGKLIKRECGYEFKEKFLKFDSRPFFVEDILDFLKEK